MQKKLIALAIAGLASGAAFADSANVTMYGVADGSFEQVSAGGVTQNGGNSAVDYASRGRVNTNNSLIGFKGAESLGNGLTAVFQFESNVNLGGSVAGGSTAASTLLGSQRDTYIGLAGAFGTVAAGYLSTPTRSTLLQFDVMPGATGAGGINSIIGHVNAGAMLAPLTVGSGLNTGNSMGSMVAPSPLVGTAGMNQNTIFRTTAIAYISPTFSGLTGVLAYVPNTSKDNANGTTGNTLAAAGVNTNAVSKNPSAWNLSLNYANGPIKVGYAYLKANDMNVLSTLGQSTGAATVALGYTGAESNNTHILGASYDFGNGLMISGVYDKVNVNLGTIAAAVAGTANSLSRTGWYLGAKYLTGPHEFAGAYASMGNNSIGCVGACAVTANYGDSGAKQWALRYAYNLSKRTQVYGLYTRVTNDANGNFDVFNGSGAAASSTNAGADPQVWGAGMRHSF